MKTIADLNLKNKTALVRVDFNVPIKNGVVGDTTRLRAHIPTIAALRKAGAKVVLMSHLGRPDGKANPAYSLKPIADKLAGLLNTPVAFAADCVGVDVTKQVQNLAAGDVLLLENLRFHADEEENTPAFAKQLATLGQVYVNDAFATAHRAHASTAGVAKFVKEKAIGLLMQKEVDALSHVLDKPKKPVVMIVAGSKISTKITLLQQLLPKADHLLIGGAMANTFLAAMGHDMGKSLYEKDHLITAKEIMVQASHKNCQIHLPVDVVGATALQTDAPHAVYGVDDLPADHMALDIGPLTCKTWGNIIAEAGTILWNGTVGAYETKPFDEGTTNIAKAVAASKAFSLAGGGDTVAALDTSGMVAKLGYVSTGGGALLEFLEGKKLPGLAAVE